MPDEPFPRSGLSQTDKLKLMNKQWHSLSDLDRAKVRSAGKTVMNYTQIAALIGLVVGWAFARRSHKSALKVANAFKPAEQPIAVVFPDGRAGKYGTFVETMNSSAWVSSF